MRGKAVALSGLHDGKFWVGGCHPGSLLVLRAEKALHRIFSGKMPDPAAAIRVFVCPRPERFVRSDA